jgi:elongation factor G
VVTPDGFLGDIVGDLNSRRAHIEGIETRPTVHVISANVPLATMFGYATDLRSVTQGRATYSMEFSHYQPVSQELAKTVLAKARS